MINKIYDKIKSFIKDNYIFIILLIITLFMFYYETPNMIYRGGGTIDLKDRIEVDNEYMQKGTISMSYVQMSKATPITQILSYIIPSWDLEKTDDDLNYEKTIEISKEFLNTGIDNAIISALSSANKEVNIKKEYTRVIYVLEKSKSDIKVGDEIYKINDKEVSSFEDITEYIDSLNENDNITLHVKNNGKDYKRYAILYKDDDDLLKMGIVFTRAYEYDAEIPVKINMKDNESGSSGGLMMALQIYNALTEEDITKGLNIVGTGSINVDGIVSEIDGVKYKLLAASKKKADIFFCPVDNYEEAIKIKENKKLNIEVIKVETLNDAINYLNNR